MSKKDFKSSINPAEFFISSAPAPVQDQEIKPAVIPANDDKKPVEKAPEGFKVNPMYVEKRSKRLNLLIQPSLHVKLAEKAQREGRSINDLIHSILEDAVKGEK